MNPQTRANVVAGALVGAVVLVLGFGSGIGAIFSRHTAYSSAAASPSPARSASSTPAGSPASTEAGDAGVGTMTMMPASTGATSASRPMAAPMTAPSVRGASTSSPASSPAGSPASQPAASASAPATTCSNETVVAAMADPFVMHVDHGHLEESPSQQAADITDPDQYTKTHTVLFENMAAPAIALGLAILQRHRSLRDARSDDGHLEESPAQQAADILDVSQYVNTHTVLVENMAAPTTGSATGTYGC